MNLETWFTGDIRATLLDELQAESTLPKLTHMRLAVTDDHSKIIQQNMYKALIAQGLEHTVSGLALPTKTALLLHYYAHLNYAKAELLPAHSDVLIGKRIGHGLTHDPSMSVAVDEDYVKVMKEGVFPLLYKHRTGITIEPGTKLYIKRLFLQLIELGSQVSNVGFGSCVVGGVRQMIAFNDKETWVLLAVTSKDVHLDSPTSLLLNKYFEEVEPPDEYRDKFDISRRVVGRPCFFESRKTFPIVEGKSNILAA